MNKFLRAPKAAVVDLTRLSTSASELREQCTIEPKYLNSVVKSIKLDIKNIDAAGVRGRILNSRRWKVHRFSLGLDSPVAHVHQQAEFSKVIVEVAGAKNKVIFEN